MNLPCFIRVPQDAADALEDSWGNVGRLLDFELGTEGMDASSALDPRGKGRYAHEFYMPQRSLGGVLPASASRCMRDLIAGCVIPEVKRDRRIPPDCGRLTRERCSDPIPYLVISPALFLGVGR